MYHRVAVLSYDPWGLAVSPNNFASQVRRMSRTNVVLSMRDFVTYYAEGRLPAKAVAITFDDGYVDNLTEAVPILQAFRAPATLFLATGPMTGGRSYWWDELASIVFDPAPLQGQVMIGQRQEQLTLGRAEAADAELRRWRAWNPPQSARQALYYQLWKELRVLPPATVNAAITELRELRGEVQTASGRPMSAPEVKRLASDATFSLAGHTVDHADLPSMPDEEVSRQILQGRQQIAGLVGENVVGFAYPYGRFTEKTRHLVREAGFEWACTTEAGYVSQACDRFALPRLTAVDRPDIGWTRDAPCG